MKRHFETPHASTAEPQELELSATATLPVADVLRRVGSSDVGLSSAEAGRRLGIYGPNVLAAHGVSAWAVLARQLRSYLLLLLFVAAVVSAVVGDLTEALIIGAIMAMSIGLSFFNEYRSEQAVEELHSEIKHLAAVDRDGAPAEIAVTQLVPGDVVHLRVGDVIPADLRLLEVHELECDESVLTGESRAADKTAEAQPPGDSPLDLRSCVFMGTLVSGGGGRGVVVRTGSRTAFGAIAVRLGERQGVTAFQQGLQDFSRLLATVTAVLAGSIFLINAALGRSILQSALFALAIAVGLTPQLLPAIVTVSLSTGARRLAKKSVIVKRLVAIEDLGNIDVLFTDKTGTLTEGRISFAAALDTAGHDTPEVLRLGLLCNDAAVSDGRVIGGNPLDQALWEAPAAGGVDVAAFRRLAARPFDYERRLGTVLVEGANGRRTVIVKGAPEIVLALCNELPAGAQSLLDGQFAGGSRVVAVATRAADGETEL
ncbi:MAG: HAD-IC family P-type ATPase, partial [Gaiellaceae bacterium]